MHTCCLLTRLLPQRIRRSEQARDRAARRRTQKDKVRQAGAGGSLIHSLLQSVGYDISSHAAESADWLNVLCAQAVAGYREDVLAGGHVAPGEAASSSNTTKEKDPIPGEAKERTAREFMQDILNRSTGKAASFLDPIRVTEVDFGDQYPLFSNARIRPADDAGRMRIEVDVDYADHITMAIDTKLVINMPRPRFAVLPISLSLTITRFSGALAIELFSTDPSSFVLPTDTAKSGAAAEPPRSRHRLHFSLHPDFALDATASSLLGSRAKLQDVPKIEQLLVGRLRAWVHERFVWPRFWCLTLPNLVPSPAAAAAAGGPTATSTAQPPQQDLANPYKSMESLSNGGASIILNGEPLDAPEMQLLSGGVDRRGGDDGPSRRLPNGRHLEHWRERTASATTGSRTSAASAAGLDSDVRRRFQSSAGGWGRASGT